MIEQVRGARSNGNQRLQCRPEGAIALLVLLDTCCDLGLSLKQLSLQSLGLPRADRVRRRATASSRRASRLNPARSLFVSIRRSKIACSDTAKNALLSSRAKPRFSGTLCKDLRLRTPAAPASSPRPNTGLRGTGDRGGATGRQRQKAVSRSQVYGKIGPWVTTNLSHSFSVSMLVC